MVALFYQTALSPTMSQFVSSFFKFAGVISTLQFKFERSNVVFQNFQLFCEMYLQH